MSDNEAAERLRDIRARAKAEQPLKAFDYYRANGQWNAYRPFIEEAQQDRMSLLALLDAALAHERSAGAAPSVTALARAMKSQHAALMPDAKPLSDELVAAMATDLLARLSEGTDR